MTNRPKPGDVPGEPPARSEVRKPKRGAFPTPKSDIEAATPFVPDVGDAHERTDESDDATAPVDDEQEE